jgi:beta-galactosidase
VVDEKGNVVPNANIPVLFTITGNGELAVIGNANPADMESFKQPGRNTFRGKCLLILRPKGKAGETILEANAEGLEPQKKQCMQDDFQHAVFEIPKLVVDIKY